MKGKRAKSVDKQLPKIVDIMEALRASLAAGKSRPKRGKREGKK